MKPGLRATLDKALQDWIFVNAEHEDRSQDFLISPDLIQQMGEAAAAVYDGAEESQRFHQQENE